MFSAFRVLVLSLISSQVVHCARLPFTGTSESGAEFGEKNIPGTLNKDYTWPVQSSFNYFQQNGMNTLRIPFLWERLQPNLYGSFDATYFAALQQTVHYAIDAGSYAILDPHNYARYKGQLVNSTSVPNAAFANFWSQLASVPLFKSQSKLVIFGLMNEPNNMPTEQWFNAAQAAINAIRSTGATNLITVPGNSYTGAHSWTKNYYGTPNSIVALTITDPGNNMIFEFHQYLDSDFSGTHTECVSNTVGSSALNDATNWLRTNKKKGFLGEFGGGANSVCQAAVTDLLSYMEANSDVWVGWNWWSAGPWWGTYFLSIEPPSTGGNAAQMAWLKPFTTNGNSASGGGSSPTLNPTPSSSSSGKPTTSPTGTSTSPTDSPTSVTSATPSSSPTSGIPTVPPTDNTGSTTLPPTSPSSTTPKPTLAGDATVAHRPYSMLYFVAPSLLTLVLIANKI